MIKLFLTSSASTVISDVISRLDFSVSGKKLVFIKTAAEDLGDVNPDWLQEDRQALRTAGFLVDDYTLTGKNEAELRNDLFSYDVIFVSGGNTFYLLQEAQKSGFLTVITDLVKSGKVYIGSSAGSVICGPDISLVSNLDDPKVAPDLDNTKGFTIVDFVILPHWGSDYFRKLYLEDEMEHAYTLDNQIILLNDNQYVEVQDDWYRIVDVKKSYV